MNTLNNFLGSSMERKKFNFDKPLENIDTEALSSFDEWRKHNPDKSINEFYRENG